jgi:hypothetical protein
LSAGVAVVPSLGEAVFCGAFAGTIDANLGPGGLPLRGRGATDRLVEELPLY